MIELPLFGQRDSRWSQLTLGNNPPGATDRAGHPFNLYWYGCLLCCQAMLANRRPDEMNDCLKAAGHFAAMSGVANTFDINICAPHVKLDSVHPTTGKWDGVDAPVHEMDTLLTWLAHDAAYIEVDSSLARKGLQQHFVVSPGLFGDAIAILDPWFSDRTFLLPRYGHSNLWAVYRFVLVEVKR